MGTKFGVKIQPYFQWQKEYFIPNTDRKLPNDEFIFLITILKVFSLRS